MNSQIIQGLKDILAEGAAIERTKQMDGFYGNMLCVNSSMYKAWIIKILTFINNSGIDAPDLVENLRAFANKESYYDYYNRIKLQIAALIDLYEKGYMREPQKNQHDWSECLDNIFSKFHKVARQLRSRHSNRETIKIEDEYDVQDLLHALLLLHFDDVRPEEWTPSYAGGAVRVDFLLKDCKTFVEVKKTRPSMTAKELGEQLLIDREKYKAHPDCERLYCFVYDPEGHLGNPIGIKHDLEKGQEDFLKVFIMPDWR